MKQKHFNKLIIALSIHIFSVHCKLLYYLNPGFCRICEKITILYQRL